MKIGIVGLGLIGGSLGLDLRQQGHKVLGVSRNPQTCELAVEMGAVDEASLNLASLSQADLIFLATPMEAIVTTLAKLTPHLTPETIVTDVASVKSEIVSNCVPLWWNFVGGHPMAGNSNQGIQAAQLHLFQQAPYVITPLETTPTQAIKTLETIAKTLGAQVHYCSPEAHDRAVAWISHLPVMVSASLIAACETESEIHVQKLAQQLASSGFRDTSRVGGGNVELGVMMARYNREHLLASLKQYSDTLTQLTAYIEESDWSAIATFLQDTQQVRPKFLRE